MFVVFPKLFLKPNTFLYILILRNFDISLANEIFHTLGSFRNPFLHNFINSQQHCGIHLVFKELALENLEHTQNIAVTLTKLRNETIIGPDNALNLFKNKGWACELLILYVKNFTPSNPGQLVNSWFKLYIKQYTDWIIPTKNPSQLLTNEYFRILLLAGQNPTNLPKDLILTYPNLLTITRLLPPGNALAILYLPEITDNATLCIISKNKTDPKSFSF